MQQEAQPEQRVAEVALQMAGAAAILKLRLPTVSALTIDRLERQGELVFLRCYHRRHMSRPCQPPARQRRRLRLRLRRPQRKRRPQCHW